MSYTSDYASINYEYIQEKPRTYVNKYYGNDRGLSLKSLVEQGYVEKIDQMKPVFSQMIPIFKEDFVNSRVQSVTQKQLSEREKSWPHKYYQNRIGHSLRAITKDEGIKEMEQFKDFSLNPKYPITQRYESQGTIKNLLRSTEEYSNYNNKPFRDGYKKLQKSGPIRSGPFRHNENRMGHSLAAITQSGGGLAYSN